MIGRSVWSLSCERQGYEVILFLEGKENGNAVIDIWRYYLLLDPAYQFLIFNSYRSRK